MISRLRIAVLLVTQFLGLATSQAQVQTVDAIADLRAIADPADNPVVQVLGYHVPGDGGGGLISWDGTSTVPDDGGTAFVPDTNPAAGRYLRPASKTLDVRWFGAKGDGVADDSDALQAALDKMAEIPCLEFPAGSTFRVTRSLQLTKSRNHVMYIIRGNGSTLLTTDDNVSILQRLPADYNEASLLVSIAFRISELHFRGKYGSVGTKGIELGATYNTVIEGCHFLALNTGVDFLFCLKGVIRDCMATHCFDNAFVIRGGKGVFSSDHNTQSNHAIIDATRVFNWEGAFSSFSVIACSGVHLIDCIAEGGNPRYNVFYDYDHSNTVKSFFISNPHFENAPSGALVRLMPGGGVVGLSGVFTQHQNTTVIDASGGLLTMIRVEDFAYLPSGCKFNGGIDNHTWQFVNCAADVLNTVNWVGDRLPNSAHSYGRNVSGNPYPKVMASGGYAVEVANGHLGLKADHGIKAYSKLSIGAAYWNHCTLGLHRTWENWNPGAIPAGGTVAHTFTVPEADYYEKYQVVANLTSIAGLDIMISASVSGPNTVRVMLFNPTGSSITVPGGNVLITVRKWE